MSKLGILLDDDDDDMMIVEKPQIDQTETFEIISNRNLCGCIS